MNPEIIKFWNSAGYYITYDTYRISDDNLGNPQYQVFWRSINRLNQHDQYNIAYMCSGIEPRYYYKDGKSLTEQHMLRLIKLKAFL